MDFFAVIFYLMAVITVGSAVLVVFSRNIMYSAFSLLFTFFGVAGLYVLLNADFLAITQIMVYIGGILILIIFGVMLTTRISGVDIKTGVTGKFQLGIAGLLTAVLFVMLAMIFNSTKWFTAANTKPAQNSINLIGNALLTNYLLAFEAASVLLLIAIVGAALIARRKH